jgi:hypothetical protein
MSHIIDRVKSEGLKSIAFSWLRERATQYNPFRQGPLAFVFAEDAAAVDWTVPQRFNDFGLEFKPDGFDVAWVISPPGRTSGGHQNAFRFMKVLEDAGHRVTVFLYSPAKLPVISVDSVRSMMSATTAYPDLKAEILIYEPSSGIPGNYDAIFASDWGTAYASFRYAKPAKRFYFTQDFEPWFFSRGSDYVLAENTYRFGFHGISAGQWLARKLTQEFNMSGGSYDYGVDSEKYNFRNFEKRNEVVFYARPPTPRRATEFGLIALSELNRLRPDIVINLVGWDMSDFDVPFPFVNNTALDISQLNSLYNRCSVALVFSLTNLSLLPMEVMAAGAVPMINDGDNTRDVFDSPHIEYVPLSPRAIAERIISVVDNPDAIEYAQTIAESVAATHWSDPAESFIEEFLSVMTARP